MTLRRAPAAGRWAPSVVGGRRGVSAKRSEHQQSGPVGPGEDQHGNDHPKQLNFGRPIARRALSRAVIHISDRATPEFYTGLGTAFA